MFLFVLVVLAGIVAVAVWLVGIYNTLVRLRNQVKNAWSQIDVQLKRRYDLVPNLIETARGYMQHERSTLENITNARSRAMNAQTVAEKSKAESALTDAVSKFLVTVENYPELKANQNFLALQEELSSTENKIAFARQNYNDQTLFYNNKVQMFPSNVMAGMFGFAQESYFQLPDKAQAEAPKVKF